jgi:hypothetical protein
MDGQGAHGLDVGRMVSVGDLLGRATLRVAVEGLRRDLAAAFSTAGAERAEAHGLASQAEMVGFMELGAACRAVEVSARAGLPLGGDLAAVAEARDRAVGAIDAFLAHDGDTLAAATAASDLFLTPRFLNSAAR